VPTVEKCPLCGSKDVTQNQTQECASCGAKFSFLAVPPNKKKAAD